MTVCQQEQIRIVLIDDHAIVRESVGRLLSCELDFQVVGSAPDAGQGIELIRREDPDIALFDIDMPGTPCFDAIRRLRQEQVRCKYIFLSAFLHDQFVDQAIALEARGYVTKSEPFENLAMAIRQAAAGRVYFSAEVRSRIVADSTSARLPPGPRTRLSTLSPREVDVLRLLARGLTKKKVASFLQISVKTVEGHSQSLMKKLDVHDRVSLARFAIREGLADA